MIFLLCVPSNKANKQHPNLDFSLLLCINNNNEGKNCLWRLFSVFFFSTNLPFIVMASHQYPINGTLTNPPSSHTGISPSAPPLSRHKSSNSGTDQWKISSANNGDRKATTTLPSARVDYIDSFSESPISISYSQSKQQLNNGTLSRRPQSPFSRLDRYKPKSPIINAERVSALTPKPSAITKSPVTEEDLIEETIDNTAIVGEEKGTTIEEKLARKQSRPLPKKDYVPWTWWSGFAFCLTYCIPNWALLMCGKKRTKVVQQAWREKVTDAACCCT